MRRANDSLVLKPAGNKTTWNTGILQEDIKMHFSR
jgi:hypothetical protein